MQVEQVREGRGDAGVMVVLKRVFFSGRRRKVERERNEEEEENEEAKKVSIDTSRFQLLRFPLSLYFLREHMERAKGYLPMYASRQSIERSRKDCPAKSNYRKKE